MTPTQQAILNAFWHKGRKTFVPLTFEEIVFKSRVPLGVARGVSKDFINSGLVKMSRTDRNANARIYELTKDAQMMVSGGLIA